MCLGPATLAIVTAIGTFASGAVSSIASYQQQQQEAQNAAAIANQQYQNQMAAYQQSERGYAESLRVYSEAANRGYVSEQSKLKAEYQKASQQAQERQITSLQQQGTILSSGRTGQGYGLLLSDAERTASRDLAYLGQNLAYATEDYWVGAQGIFNQHKSSINAAASQRMLKPSAPIPVPGPSGIGLVAGIGSAAIGGLSTYTQLKPPKAGK